MPPTVSFSTGMADVANDFGIAADAAAGLGVAADFGAVVEVDPGVGACSFGSVMAALR